MTIKTPELRAALRKRFCQPEWACLEEVSNGTGARGGVAYADMVVMSLWPSRGLELHGIEIKVSRSDWKREAQKPLKAETIAAYCDRWWVATAPGVIQDEGEIPPAWGWMEFDGKTIKTRRQAASTTAKNVDRSFLAALLRRAGQVGDGVIEEELRGRLEKMRERNDAAIKAEIDMRTRKASALIEAVRKYEEASGLEIANGWLGPTPETTAKLAKALHSIDSMSIFGGLEKVAERLEVAAAEIRAAISEAPIIAEPKDEAA